MKIKLSSIISAFNSEQFIHGCLENLVNQTIYKKGEMEILIIDSGSHEKENLIILEFQKKYQNIRYFKTDRRETLYRAWNRGIRMSKGNFLTNSNTDDRHESTCLETLVLNLENNHNIDLVYGNLFKSTIANERFNENDKSTPCSSQSFFPISLLLHNYIGAQPVWRKSIHAKIGLFDENYEVMGDYEFVLRAVTNGCKFRFIPEAVGLMLWHKNALSTRNTKPQSEKAKLLKFYRSSKQIEKIYHSYSKNRVFIQQAYNDLGIRSLCYYPQFNSCNPLFDFSFAQECFSQNSDHISQHNLRSINKILCPQSRIETTIYQNLFFYSYSEKLPSEYELKQVAPLYLRHIGDENIQDKLYQKYSFDLSKFYQFFFGHLGIESMSTTSCLYVWGYNERGKVLANYLENIGPKNMSFIDCNPEFHSGITSSKNISLISLDDLEKADNPVFILAMSSHHWPNVTSQIEKKFPGSKVLTIDKN